MEIFCVAPDDVIDIIVNGDERRALRRSGVGSSIVHPMPAPGADQLRT
jgi:hypothetical protein